MESKSSIFLTNKLSGTIYPGTQRNGLTNIVPYLNKIIKTKEDK